MNDSEITLSVVVAVYNVEAYVERAIDSIIGQTYKKLEIILVDDGSTDRSGAICDSYAKRDDRIVVIHKENGGLISARKAGIGQATGEYTTSFDSDDWIEEDAYEKIVEKLRIFRPDMLTFGFKKEFENQIEEYKLEMKEGLYNKDELWMNLNSDIAEKKFYHRPINVSQCTKVTKTDILRKYQMDCPDWGSKNEDEMVIFPCLLNIDSLYCHEGTYYHYCMRKKSVTWDAQEKNYGQYKVVANHLIKAYRECKNRDRIEEYILLYKVFVLLIVDFMEKMLVGDQCLCYPKLKRGNRIIVYGKGLLADRLMTGIRESDFCEIVANIDRTDAEIIQNMREDQYDYVVMAVLDAAILNRSIENLLRLGVKEEKIQYIHKEDITWEILPEEIRDMY